MEIEVLTGVYDPPFSDSDCDDDDCPEFLSC